MFCCCEKSSMLDSFYWGQPEELLSFGSFFLSRCVPPILQFVKICLHIICSLYMKPFSRFSKNKSDHDECIFVFTAFPVYYLSLITMIPSKKHLTYTSFQITYLFNWHFRETLFIFRTILLPL